jgi:hypothetical protein
VAAAVVALGDAGAVGPLSDYLVRYHADSAFSENTEALNVMADGLLRHGQVAERELLERLLQDAHTLLPLKQHIQSTFEALAAAERQQEEQPAPTPEPTGPTPEEICAEQRQQHYQLSQDEVSQAMRSHADELRGCFQAEMARNPDTGMVRIVWLITSDGEGVNWDILPSSPELLTCLLPHLRSVRFPCIRAYRQRARFGVNLVRPTAATPPTPAPPSPGTTQPSPGWGPPPPGAPTSGETPSEVPPTEYPDEYPEQLPP